MYPEKGGGKKGTFCVFHQRRRRTRYWVAVDLLREKMVRSSFGEVEKNFYRGAHQKKRLESPAQCYQKEEWGDVQRTPLSPSFITAPE